MRATMDDRRIAPTKKKLGSYVELTYDARLEYLGLNWFRVQGGFGGKGDRDDWVADVPGICVSVSRWHNKPGYGWDGDLDRETAMKKEVESMLDAIGYRISETVARLAELHEGQTRLQAAMEGGT